MRPNTETSEPDHSRVPSAKTAGASRPNAKCIRIWGVPGPPCRLPAFRRPPRPCSALGVGVRAAIQVPASEHPPSRRTHLGTAFNKSPQAALAQADKRTDYKYECVCNCTAALERHSCLSRPSSGIGGQNSSLVLEQNSANLDLTRK